MKDYLDFTVTGDLISDIERYFLKHERADIYEHTMDVVHELEGMEKQFGQVEPGSLTACYCHDLGRVVPVDEALMFCDYNSIEVRDEEKTEPSILHQKISCFLAERVFGIKDTVILNAIRYHSTLRKAPSMTEIEVFLSDKMSWKEAGYIEIARSVKEVLKKSKENAVYYFLSDLNSKRESLKLYHTNSQEAFEYFNCRQA